MTVVTGATGHIGNALVRELIAQQEDVLAFVAPGDDISCIQDLDLDIVYGDVRNIDDLIMAFVEAKIVYHLAGIVSITSKNIKNMYEVNVGGTENVIEACLECNVERLIYTSSVHAFTEPPQGICIEETLNFEPEKVIGHYAKSKAEATLAVLDGIEKGLNAIIVHPSGVIGPYEYKLSYVGQMILDFIHGNLPCGVEGAYDFVDVRDVAKGIILAKERGTIGENYILSGYLLSIEDIFNILAQITGLAPPNKKAPLWVAKIFCPFITMYAKLIGKRPIYTPYSLYTLSSNSLFSHDKATKELGYTTRPIEETFKDTIVWFVDNGYIDNSVVKNIKII